MTKQYSEKDGFTVSDLFHYGIDHLYAAGCLFQLDAHTYDSAGYLAHLGVELILILKGWHLHQFGHFGNTHRLVVLLSGLEEADPNLQFATESKSTLEQLDLFYELRYPRRHDPVETGSEDWGQINDLVNAIWAAMPQVLLDKLDEMDATRKGGRVLMRRKANTGG